MCRGGQVREFLGTAGFCRLWIPGFATLAAPLYPLTKEKGEFTWIREHQLAFETLKKALLQAPALALPDLNKPFTLYIIREIKKYFDLNQSDNIACKICG